MVDVWSRTGSGPKTGVFLCALLAACFLGGVVLVPILEAAAIPWARALRGAYGPLCHQLPSRSFVVAGRPLAVCARCTGLYAGGASALLLTALAPAVLRWSQLRWLAAACAPTSADVVVHLAGGTGLPNLARFIAALPLGFVAGLLLSEAICDLALPARRSPKSTWTDETVGASSRS